jgi:hypothetical protein
MPPPSGTNDDNILFEPGQSETARLALQHEIIKYGMKSLIKAPIDLSKPGLKTLDQATADGIDFNCKAKSPTIIWIILNSYLYIYIFIFPTTSLMYHFQVPLLYSFKGKAGFCPPLIHLTQMSYAICDIYRPLALSSFIISKVWMYQNICWTCCLVRSTE